MDAGVPSLFYQLLIYSARSLCKSDGTPASMPPSLTTNRRFFRYYTLS